MTAKGFSGFAAFAEAADALASYTLGMSLRDLGRGDDTSAQVAARTRADFRPLAERLARDLSGHVVRFRPGLSLTAKAEWFVTPDDRRLVVVAGGHEQVGSMDEVLAYALAWQCDRDLLLVLPESRERQTLARLAWVDTPVRVFLHDSGGLRPAVIPSRSEVLTAAADTGLRTTAEHGLGDLAPLVAWVTSWADDHWALAKVKRPSYQSWHCAGRQVLKVARSGGGVRITAGVNYSKNPPAGEEKALTRLVNHERPLSRAELAHIQARVTRAIWRRLAEQDQGDVEHRLQGALALGPLRTALGLTELAREYPAWRGDRRPGFIDFLGLDRQNRLHVVETKVNPDDVTAVLQALDYVIWVQANAEKIRDKDKGRWQEPGGAEKSVACDFVCAPRIMPAPDGSFAPRGHAIGGYLAGQLEAISPSIPWSISLVPDPLAEVPEMTRLPAHQVPPAGPLVAEPAQGLRWAARVQAGLVSPARGHMHADAESALLPAARPVLLDLAARNLDHRWVLHVRSSQAFALNLFAPLDEAGRRKVLGYLGHQVLRADPPEFEYSDDSDRLAESSHRSRHQTQVDVVLRGTGASGERVVALIEVKFTEIDFSGCSAYDNPANPARDVCRSPGLFGSQPDRCFQLANHGYGWRYADYLSGVPVNMPSGSRSDGGCLVRRGLSQPMRKLALAHLLLVEAEADRAVYALCAPDEHPTIWRRLDEVRSAFPDTDRRTIRAMAASVVASLHPDGGSAFHRHYRLQD